jgi:hypothetical protein
MRSKRLLSGVYLVMLVLAVSVAAASAETLPDVSIALGGSYPIHLLFKDNGKTASFFESVNGEGLESIGFELLLLFANLSALGTYLASLLGVKDCNTAGDAEGVILMNGEFHVVLLAGKTRLGLLLLQPKVTVECGASNLKFEGLLLASLQNTGSESTELAQFGAILKGNSKGKAELTKYINDSGTESVALYLSNFGTGFLESALDIEEEITMTTLESKMFVISPR